MEYEKCFQPTIERGASKHLIMSEDPNLILAVDSLINSGVLVGQGEMMSEDVIYYLSPERDNTPKQLIGMNGHVLYETPEDRLKRPTDFKKPIV